MMGTLGAPLNKDCSSFGSILGLYYIYNLTQLALHTGNITLYTLHETFDRHAALPPMH